MDIHSFGVLAALAWSTLLIALGLQKFFNAESRNRPLRVAATRGEAVKPSEASAERRREGFERRAWPPDPDSLCASALKQKPLPAVVFLVCALIATVEAQKQGQLRVENGELRVEMRRGEAATATLNSQLSTLNFPRTLNHDNPVSPDDIARGYRLVAVIPNAAAPTVATNATTVGNWHVHGARDDWRWLDLSPFAFPLGADDARHSLVFLSPDARLRPRPREPGREIRVAETDACAAVPGVSALTVARDADDGHPTITWSSFLTGDAAGTNATAQIELFANGDFITRAGDVECAYARLDPADWDGDGLANAIDPAPTVPDGDAFGTGVAWLNANCAGVLAAQDGTNGTIDVTWHAGVCADAYDWLTFTAGDDGAHVAFICDGASDLGDLFVIARPGQTCRVPLLVGASYRIESTAPLAGLASSVPETVICPDPPPASTRRFTATHPLACSLTGTAPDFAFATVPAVGARLTAARGGCCPGSFDLVTLTWRCPAACTCAGFAHPLTFDVTWEGYTRSFVDDVACLCQEANKTDPNAWFALDAPPLLVKDGNSHTVAGAFHPPCETNATLTLACLSGADRLTVVESNACAWVVRGAAASATAGDVAFELRLELDGTIYATTQTLTVAEVVRLDMTSAVAGDSACPPPFPGGVASPFSVTNSPNPDRHLVIPFHHVARTNDFSVADFAVDLALALNPAVTNAVADWELLENTCASGALVPGGGLSAQFVNPRAGGIVRVRATCDGAPATEGTLVLPLGGASLDDVIAADLAAADRAVARLQARSGRLARQWPFWGYANLVAFGQGDYRGRADSAERPTVWVYNQIDDDSGQGAVATWHGVSVRVAKASNFLVAYACERLGIWHLSQWLSQLFGTANDATASLSWAAGVDVAAGADFTARTALFATNAWPLADIKTRQLWPNPAPADNHCAARFFNDTDRDPNRVFLSPGFLLEDDADDDENETEEEGDDNR